MTKVRSIHPYDLANLIMKSTNCYCRKIKRGAKELIKLNGKLYDMNIYARIRSASGKKMSMETFGNTLGRATEQAAR
jgi:hypothetical protein